MTRTGLSGKYLAGKFAASVRKVAYASPVDMPPPRSLGRYAPAVRLRRAEAALTEPVTTLPTGSGMDAQRQKRKKKEQPEKAAALPFFHRLRLPLTSLTFSETVCLGLGETRCGFKMSTVSGRQLPPAASTFPPYRLPDTLPPFSLAGLVALSHSSRAFLLCGISGDLGSSLQAWAVMQDPPVQPDCCASSGNCSLEANPEKTRKTPLAAAIGNWDLLSGSCKIKHYRVLEVMARLRLH